MQKTPRIKTVSVCGPARLLVRFKNGIEKTYDCSPLLDRPQFQLLKIPAFFRAVRVDPGGYGVSWNDDIDLAECELWNNGTLVGGESRQMTA